MVLAWYDVWHAKNVGIGDLHFPVFGRTPLGSDTNLFSPGDVQHLPRGSSARALLRESIPKTAPS